MTYIDNNYKFAQISNNIFENNQKRFRLKNYFNILNNSNIIECKSYFENKCYIIVNSEKDIYDKIPEINYLVISYDVICFKVIYKNIIEKLFKNPNIQFFEKDYWAISNKQVLDEFLKRTNENKIVYNYIGSSLPLSIQFLDEKHKKKRRSHVSFMLLDIILA